MFAETVLDEVLGPGRRKPEAEPPLRNELVEADPCIPAVPDVEVSSSKPTIRMYVLSTFSPYFRNIYRL